MALVVSGSELLQARYHQCRSTKFTTTSDLQCLLFFYLLSLFLLWSPYGIGQTIIFLPCDFYLSSSLLLFFPRLISAVGDWMSTILPHMVWPYCKFRMHVWNALYAAHWKYRTQKNCLLAPSHNFVGLYLRSWGMYQQSEKKTC